MEKATYDVTQAAKYLGLSRSSIYRLIEQGHLPASKFGTAHCIRLRVEDLETYKQHKAVEVEKWA